MNLSKIKTGKISEICFSTLEAICEVLDCQPGDILEYQKKPGGEGDKQFEQGSNSDFREQ